MVPEAMQYQFESDIGYADVPFVVRWLRSRRSPYDGRKKIHGKRKAVKYEFKSHHLYDQEQIKKGSDDMVDYYKTRLR